MNVTGYYYLHSETGSLIWKREIGGTAADLYDSDFVRMFWPVDLQDRDSAWRLLIEASALGAERRRIRELAEKWGCDDLDAETFAARLGVAISYNPEAEAYRAAVTPGGVSAAGVTALDALAELCKALGYKPKKMWGPTFGGLVTSYRKQLNSGKDEEK